MPRRISYRQLEGILVHAGFHKSMKRGSHLLFVHQESGTRVVLPFPRQRSVPYVYVRAIGRMLDEYGIMPAEEFYQLVLEKES